MPRSLPVTTGLPLSVGLTACSQDAKKASASMCRMARAKERSVSGCIGWSSVSARVFAHDGGDHRDDFQLLLRHDRLITWIGSRQIQCLAALAQIFHGPFAINF